ncbi:MAG: hypothetical protein KUG74_05880 [Rhodobacteraceae bacterium]|nr:hypothetical protein [Paracoccaceae bacterium]
MTVFALMVFLMMLIAGGTAVDFMRHETIRSQVQYNADRAALAAASLKQDSTPDAVVADYLDKSTIFGEVTYLSSSSISSGTRSVSVDISSTIDTYFLKMLGIDTLTASASATAEEKIQAVEISLVLDISESMNESLRLENLKTASKEFVSSMLTSESANATSISVVPFAGFVSLGDGLASQYNITSEHDYSTCVRFPISMFDSTALSTTVSLNRQAHYDSSGSEDTPIHNPICPVAGDGKNVVPLSQDETALHSMIDGLTAGGTTAIDLGLRWATALLDPGTQGVVTNLIASGEVDSAFAGRPYNFNDSETMKVIVIMTDGDNTRQWDIKPEYKSGNSYIYVDAAGVYSAWLPKLGKYFVPSNGNLQDAPEGGDAAINLSYTEVWNTFSVGKHAEYFFKAHDTPTYVAMRDAEEPTIVGSSANSRMLELCRVAKDTGIVIFSIGFDSPKNGWAVMKTCASSKSHFYDSEGLDISNTFASIAGAINKLKLTQ